MLYKYLCAAIQENHKPVILTILVYANFTANTIKVISQFEFS